MRIIIQLFIIMVTATYISAQTYIDTIAVNSCECLQDMPSGLEQDEKNVRIGICIIEASNQFATQLLRDHNIDMNQIDSQGHDLGRLVGIKMAVECPDVFAENADDESDGSYDEYELTGEVIGITNLPFVSFSIKNFQGKTQSFYWFTFLNVDTDFDIQQNYLDLKGRQVKVYFIEQELFDPRINEYRIFNVLTGLTPQ